ncbi:M23 family metallopeptidase [Paucibacter sp. R3-3]|uniref:M23 family metallopeptidase n=1 Tax=Roseateles agri TaxID=3098619 RepID=A0ABU5DC16_9BURK|nr:M23 family metallopeptidase [Paucibacter sp. R3-3]MDY0743800.1 M23 family metallopeptidase [Paucibacter sp. R3-3]
MGLVLATVFFQAGASAQDATVHQAQVEARILAAPQAVTGSDGQKHLAYELRITSFQDDDDPLRLTRLAVFADAGAVPLTVIEGAALQRLLNHAVAEGSPGDGVAIGSGRSLTLFLWLTLPQGRQPGRLRHQLSFLTAKGIVQRADDVQTAVVGGAPISIDAPLRGGLWLAVEGPGNALSHHWGSPVAIDGRLSVPQRYAIDWFGLDEGRHSLRSRHENLASSVDEDWFGYGKDVLAVADGIVVDARDGLANGKPLAPQEEPQDLTARTLYGNFVILRIAPGVYAHYAHLQQGSVTVRIGQRVRRGAIVGRLGQTGSAGAPHLHFHLSDLPTFERSEGLPFVIDRFTWLGQGKIEESFDPTVTASPSATQAAAPRRNAMPLDGDIVTFP